MRIFASLILFWPLFSNAVLIATAPSADSAAAAYESGDYNRALEAYENDFNQSLYSEQSLYRMAYIHEQMRNYPQAIFYLKKASQEFGGKMIDEKIVQLMQKNGSANYFTDDWITYYQVWRKWSWVLWALFFCAGILLATWILTRDRQTGFMKRSFIPYASGFVFGISGAFLFVHLFILPARGVIIEPTAFYNGPGYSEEWKAGSFSTGETVSLIRKKDIWVEIRVGEKTAWVPAFTVREL